VLKQGHLGSKSLLSLLRMSFVFLSIVSSRVIVSTLLLIFYCLHGSIDMCLHSS